MKKLTTLLAILLCTSACHIDELSRDLRDLWKQPEPKPTMEPEEKLRQESSQLLHEMFRVVLLRDPVSSLEFEVYLNPLMQGASLEGIYNGFTHSAYYRKLEESQARADTKSLVIFSAEMAKLTAELRKPTDFDIAPPYTPQKFEKRFSRFSLLGLKRVLGDETLRLIGEKSKNADELADWYSKWAARIAEQYKVDLGLDLRGKADAKFHRDWAARALATGHSDRITWEALNRVHRVLNSTVP